MLLLVRFADVAYAGYRLGMPSSLLKFVGLAFVYDVFFWLKFSFIMLLPFAALYFISKPLARNVYTIAAVIISIIHVALLQYFNQAMVPLGADLFGYKLADIKQTVGAGGGVSMGFIIIIITIIITIVAGMRWLSKKLKVSSILAIVFAVALPVFYFFGYAAFALPGLATEYENNAAINKTDYFLKSSYNHFFPQPVEVDIYADSYIGDFGDANTTVASYNYVDAVNYPFLHVDSTQDVLSPFFNKAATPPNVVILLVEGLGRAFSNDGAYLGSFTPFLDSLSKASLYWENFLSEGGRTFAVLPSLLGSLPFAKNGFMEMGAGMPDHLSLLSLLKFNGYQTAFYYGGDSKFDNMKAFLNKSNVDRIFDMETFSGDYVKMPQQNGFTWGYGDKELFRKYFDTKQTAQASSFVDVLLTVSTHDPFSINEQPKYQQRFEQRLSELMVPEDRKSEYRNFEKQYASILYADDAIKGFFNNYAKRADFNNTIFIITGDHRMPELPMISKIDRYHVPFIMYSPLLSRTAKMSSISTHFDVAPTLLAHLKNSYNISTPSLASWVGSGIDTGRSLQNNHAYPLMQTKNDLVDFVMESFQLNHDDLYSLGQNMASAKVDNNNKVQQIKTAFEVYKTRNTKIINGGKLLPDSIYQKYFPR